MGLCRPSSAVQKEDGLASYLEGTWKQRMGGLTNLHGFGLVVARVNGGFAGAGLGKQLSAIDGDGSEDQGASAVDHVAAMLPLHDAGWAVWACGCRDCIRRSAFSHHGRSGRDGRFETAR